MLIYSWFLFLFVACDADREIDCGNNVCVDLRRRCDGQRDCANGLDETNCGKTIDNPADSVVVFRVTFLLQIRTC